MTEIDHTFAESGGSDCAPKVFQGRKERGVIVIMDGDRDARLDACDRLYALMPIPSGHGSQNVRAVEARQPEVDPGIRLPEPR